MARDLDLLLVNVGGTRKKVYQDLSKDFSGIEPPFWAALTAGYFRKKGFGVDVLDANALNLSLHETVQAVLSRRPKVTAIVVYSQQANTCTPIMVAVGQLCRALKDAGSGGLLALTGWHPSALPQRTLHDEACDVVIQGEGFATLLGLLQGREYPDIPGLWWRQGAEVLHTPRAGNVKDLSTELDQVAWDLLPLRGGKYRAFNWMCLANPASRTRCATMLTSLGCPHRCSFCAIHATFAQRRVRYWSPDWVLAQIDTLVRDYGVANIDLRDELFVHNPRHYLPIAEGLVRRNYGLNIAAFARVDRIDAMGIDELALMKKAGFNWFKLGIESINPGVLRGVHKGTYTPAVVRRAVRKVHDAGIDFCANFIFGLPGDTWDTMQENLHFAMELNCSFVSFLCAMAIPGSDLYAPAAKAGLTPDSWLGYATQAYEFQPLPTETLSAAEVLAFRDYAFGAYFTNPRYLAKIHAKFGPAAREHVRLMAAIPLKRKLLGD